MRISIDTREDSYEDALGVLRRAYGRHGIARKPEESPAVPEAVDSSAGGKAADASGDRSASGAGRVDAGSRTPPAKRTKKAAAKRTPAPKAAAQTPVSKATAKRGSGKKTARSMPASRPGGSRKRSTSRVAANVAPPGQSEAVRAWAQAQGIQVSNRGRMPAKAIAAYLEAHND